MADYVQAGAENQGEAPLDQTFADAENEEVGGPLHPAVNAAH